MSFVNWSDDLSVHVTLIDDQHKTLDGILNDIYDAMQLGKRIDRQQ
jgi:hemerythrin